MGSKIAWTDHTFNPWVGCQKVATGCQHCYAEAWARRYKAAAWGPQGTRVRTSEAYWRQPLKWDRDSQFAKELGDEEEQNSGVRPAAHRRRRVFCGSLCDVFEDWDGPIVDAQKNDLAWCVHCERTSLIHDACERCGTETSDYTLDHLRRDLFTLIDETPNLEWCLLTKRPEHVLRMWPGVPHEFTRRNGLPTVLHRENVWLGTSVSDQATADQNVPLLLECRDLCPVLFLSCEPLIGPIDLYSAIPAIRGSRSRDGQPEPVCSDDDLPIDWVIAGGESGPGHRTMDLRWAKSLRDQCRAAGVPFFFKQDSGPRPGMAPQLDGEVIQEFPRVSERSPT